MVNAVRIGDLDSEQLHCLESVNSNAGGYVDEMWRDAANGGYFMYKMKVIPNESQSVYLVLRKDDSGTRLYDILVDGKLIKTIDHSQPVEDIDTALYHVVIPIPDELIKGRDYVTVKLHAKRRNTAGGIFGLRILHTSDGTIVPNIYF